MLTADDITAALQQHLPAEHHAALPALVRLLAEAMFGQGDGVSAPRPIDADEGLKAALRALAGQQVIAGQSVVNFGSGNQFGDIVIGDIAGGDLFKITVQVAPKPSLLTPQEQRNRKVILQKVENAWVRGVLEQSLYQIARIELGMEQTAHAVEPHPWDAVIHRPEQANEAIPPGRPIVDVFDTVGGAMLILGAPGSGKTTVLLELARDLIARARADETLPMPVVFNLSTWAAQRLPLVDWLKLELHERYSVPHKVAAEWVEHEEVLPLLDGLDEVAAEYRDACASAINRFWQDDYGLAPLAICSRLTDYEALTSKLRLPEAVVIQPLDLAQVDRYLERAGERLAMVRKALADRPALYELFDTPLMLSIAALTYRNQPMERVPLAGTLAERHARLFDDYIRTMFWRAGRSIDAGEYTREETARRLVWLARQLVAHSLAVYYIEGMQPDWLLHSQRRRYATLYKVAVGLVFGPKRERIDLVEALSWSWSKVRSTLIRTLIGIPIAGAASVMAIGFAIEQFLWLFSGYKPILPLSLPVFGLYVGLAGGLIFGVTVGLFDGLSVKAIESRMVPNQGVSRSILSGVLSGLVAWLIIDISFGLAIGVMIGLLFSPAIGLLVGLLSGVVIGLVIGMRQGGAAAIKHYILRYLLYRQASLPFLDLVPWLDYCADRLFLHRVGGGYMFIHRLLMEHFAAMTDEDIARLSGGIEAQGRGSSRAQ